MNWKLILQLSVFGAAMAVGTVFFIPSKVEPLFWLVIFIVCAYVIATKAPGRYFLHGLLTSIVNSVWITATHVILFDTYVANHAQEAEMMARMPMAPKVMMLVTGPVVGVISGLVLGFFAVIARKILGRK